MKKGILLVLALSLMLAGASAMSSNEAARFVGEQHYYLYTGETVEEPIVKIINGEDGYWVVPVISGNAPSTFFALDSSSGELEETRATNSKLFRSADLLREYLLVKKGVSANPQVDWPIISDRASSFETISRKLSDEQFQLNIISSSVNDSGIRSDILELNSMLSAMIRKCDDISAGINESLLFEGNFITSPDTKEYNSLKSKFTAPLGLMIGLKTDKEEYESKVEQLRQKIPGLSLAADEKSYIDNLAKPPEEIVGITGYSQDAMNLKGSIDTIYSNVNARNDSQLDDFELRLQRDAAYNAINLDNPRLIDKTDSELPTLRKAAETILAKENKSYWKNREKLQKFEEEWRSTERYFENGKYELAASSAEKSITYAIAVYGDGFSDSGNDPIISTDLLILIAVVLGALLLLIFAFQNREKISGALKPGNEEEVEISKWDKP
ncbi:MAG: hypothetical protein ABID38_02810 [Candidatus Diapherotrites archaeon]